MTLVYFRSRKWGWHLFEPHCYFQMLFPTVTYWEAGLRDIAGFDPGHCVIAVCKISQKNVSHEFAGFPVVCACVCVCVCQSLSHVRLFATPCSLPGSSVHGNSPGKNTGVGCHSFLQGIFLTQGLNPGLHYSQVSMKDCITGSLYCLSQ